jgi:hypothetical protein
MKRSETVAEGLSGELTLATETKVIQRAREIAVINGRNGNDYTQNDLEQARHECRSFDRSQNRVPDGDAPERDPGEGGRAAPVRPASDEQTFAEELVHRGVQEATHDQMLAGNQTTRGQETKR